MVNFIDDEKVTFESSDSFKILKNDNYTARGKVAGEGLMNDAFLSDKGFASSKMHIYKIVNSIRLIHMSSKLVRSINNYRSILKELVHPSGHIFFGEVAIKSQILSSSLDGRFEVNPDNQLGIVSSTFVPTIVIPSFPTDNVLFEESTRDAPVRVLIEDGHLLENEESRDNVAHNKSRETIVML